MVAQEIYEGKDNVHTSRHRRVVCTICQALHNVDLSPLFLVSIFNTLSFLHIIPQNSIIVIPLQPELTILTPCFRWRAQAAIGLFSFFLCLLLADSVTAQSFRYSLSADIVDDLILAQTDPESDEKTDPESDKKTDPESDPGTDSESDEKPATDKKELLSPRVSLGFDTASFLFKAWPAEIEFHVSPKFSLAIPYQRSSDVGFSGGLPDTWEAGPTGSEDAPGNSGEIGEFGDSYRQEFGLRATYYLDGLWHGKTTRHLSVALLRESLNTSFTQTLNSNLAEPIQAAMAAAGYGPGNPGYDNITALVNRSVFVRRVDLVYKGGLSRTKISITTGQRTQGKLFYHRTEVGFVFKPDYKASWEAEIPDSDFVYRETSDEVDFPFLKIPFKFGWTIGAAF